MRTRTRVITAIQCALIVACLVACGSVTKVRMASARMKRQNDFKQLGLAYHNYHDSNTAGPADQQAFLLWAQKMDPEALPFIQQTGPAGPIKLEYGAWRLGKDFEQGTGNTVVAYDTVADPGSGQYVVLMGDGSVKMMSQAEIDAAPRPKKGKD